MSSVRLTRSRTELIDYLALRPLSVLSFKEGELNVSLELLARESVFWATYINADACWKTNGLPIPVPHNHLVVQTFWEWCRGKTSIIDLDMCLSLFELCHHWCITNLAEQLTDLVILMNNCRDTVVEIDNRMKIFDVGNSESTIWECIDRIMNANAFFLKMNPQVLASCSFLSLDSSFFQSEHTTQSRIEFDNMSGVLSRLAKIEKNICYFGGCVRDQIRRAAQARAFYKFITDATVSHNTSDEMLHGNPYFHTVSSERNLCPKDIDIFFFSTTTECVGSIGDKFQITGLKVQSVRPVQTYSSNVLIGGVFKVRVDHGICIDVVCTPLACCRENFDRLMMGNPIQSDCLMVIPHGQPTAPYGYNMYVARESNSMSEPHYFKYHRESLMPCTAKIAYNSSTVYDIQSGCTHIRPVLLDSNLQTPEASEKLSKVMRHIFNRIVRRMDSWHIPNSEWCVANNTKDGDIIVLKRHKQCFVSIASLKLKSLDTDFAMNQITFDAEHSCTIVPDLDFVSYWFD